MSSKNIYDSNYPKNADFDINAHSIYWITIFQAQYVQTMEKDLKPMGLDLPRWRIAMILRSYGQIRVSKISELAVNRLPTTTKLVQRMEKEGLVQSQKDKDDERATLISLTQKGRRLLNESLEKTHYIYSRIFEGLTPEDIESLISVLRKMHRNILK